MSHRTKIERFAIRLGGRGGEAAPLVEVELELEGRAVLEVVEGRVEGAPLVAPALRLGVQRVHALVELRALLGVRQHLHTRESQRAAAAARPAPGPRPTSLAAATSMNFFSASFFSSPWKLSGCHFCAALRYALVISCFDADLTIHPDQWIVCRRKRLRVITCVYT